MVNSDDEDALALGITNNDDQALEAMGYGDATPSFMAEPEAAPSPPPETMPLPEVPQPVPSAEGTASMSGATGAEEPPAYSPGVDANRLIGQALDQAQAPAQAANPWLDEAQATIEHERQTAIARQQATAGRNEALEQAEAKAAAQKAAVDKDVEDRVAKLDKDIAAVRAQQIDAGRWRRNLTGGQQAAWAISAIAQALAQGLTRGQFQSTFDKQVEAAVERDLAEQRDNLGNKWKAIDESKQELQLAMKRGLDVKEAANVARQTIAMRHAEDLVAASQQMTDPKARAIIAQAAQDYLAQSAKVAKDRAKASKGGGGGGGGGGAAGTEGSMQVPSGWVPVDTGDGRYFVPSDTASAYNKQRVSLDGIRENTDVMAREMAKLTPAQREWVARSLSVMDNKTAPSFLKSAAALHIDVGKYGKIQNAHTAMTAQINRVAQGTGTTSDEFGRYRIDPELVSDPEKWAARMHGRADAWGGHMLRQVRAGIPAGAAQGVTRPARGQPSKPVYSAPPTGGQKPTSVADDVTATIPGAKRKPGK